MSRFFPPSEYVNQMQVLLGLPLTPITHADYCDAVMKVQQAGEKPLDPVRLHEVLCAGDAHAGEYRSGSVHKLVGTKMVERPLPRPTSIQKLMYSFKRAYGAALRGDIPSEIVNIEAFAWQVAAAGRCLHPFQCGNRQLFLLLENHIRQAHGLPWRIDVLDKDKFHTFRSSYIFHNREHYGEIPGAV